MYIVLVIVILVGQMGNLPFFSGHPVGDPKTALHTPANITADLKCGAPGYTLCPQPWIGPDPKQDRQAFKFPDWNFLWPGTYQITKGQPVSLIYREKPIATKSEAYALAFDWNFLGAAGSLVLYACLIAFLLMRVNGSRLNFFTVYGKTLRQLALPIATISMILGIAYVMNYSGMTASLAIAFYGLPHPDPCDGLRVQIDNMSPRDFPTMQEYLKVLHFAEAQLAACEKQNGEL